jgi:hypothetical protein
MSKKELIYDLSDAYHLRGQELQALKQFVDDAIAEGYETFELDIEKCPFDDSIDDVEIKVYG